MNFTSPHTPAINEALEKILNTLDFDPLDYSTALAIAVNCLREIKNAEVPRAI